MYVLFLPVFSVWNSGSSYTEDFIISLSKCWGQVGFWIQSAHNGYIPTIHLIKVHPTIWLFLGTAESWIFASSCAWLWCSPVVWWPQDGVRNSQSVERRQSPRARQTLGSGWELPNIVIAVACRECSFCRSPHVRSARLERRVQSFGFCISICDWLQWP